MNRLQRLLTLPLLCLAPFCAGSVQGEESAALPKDYYDQLIAIREKVSQKEQEVGLGKLSPNERVLFFLQQFSEEILNGGIHQFYTNSTGRYTLETLQAMQSVGALEMAEEFKKTFVAFKNATPPPTTQDHHDFLIHPLTPKQIRAFYWFDDFYYHRGTLDKHLFLYWKTGKAVTEAELRKQNPELFELERKWAEIDALGAVKAFETYLEIYEKAMLTEDGNTIPPLLNSYSVRWKLKWSSAFNTRLVADRIEHYLALRDSTKEVFPKGRNGYLCVGLFGLLESQPSLEPWMEDRLLKWAKRGLAVRLPDGLIVETLSPAAVLHQHWPERYPGLKQNNDQLEGAGPYLKAIEEKKL